MDTNTPEVKKFCDEVAPDLSIIEARDHGLPLDEDYNYEVFGKELAEETRFAILLIRKWLNSPTLYDECGKDGKRGEREDKAEEYGIEIVQLLKWHKAHNNFFGLVYISLIKLLDSDKNSEKPLFDVQKLEDHKNELQAILNEFRVVQSLRDALHDTKINVWSTLRDYFSEEEIDMLITNPHPLLRVRIEDLMHELESIAVEILKKFEL